MKRVLLAGMVLGLAIIVSGCSTPSQKVKGLRLGMTPDEVVSEMGRPYAVRAAKLYEDGNFLEVWEYIPSVFSVALFADRYDKSYWTIFEGGKLVQWGEPGDLSGSTTLTGDAAVTEFRGERSTR